LPAQGFIVLRDMSRAASCGAFLDPVSFKRSTSLTKPDKFHFSEGSFFNFLRRPPSLCPLDDPPVPFYRTEFFFPPVFRRYRVSLCVCCFCERFLEMFSEGPTSHCTRLVRRWSPVLLLAFRFQSLLSPPFLSSGREITWSPLHHYFQEGTFQAVSYSSLTQPRETALTP